MSRSNPLLSLIGEKLRRKSPNAPPHKRSLRRRIAIKSAAIFRWLHIYVSLFGLASVLFFSLTGVTLNHPNLFFSESERRTEIEADLKPDWVDANGDVAKLEVVEHLRKTNGVRGALGDFTIEDSECLVTFRGPGYAADANINRSTGHYRLTQTSHGFIAIINDLHKGRDSGPVWSAVIDISAIVLGFISISGLVLLFYLKLRRVKGVVVTVAGTVVLIALWWFGVQ